MKLTKTKWALAQWAEGNESPLIALLTTRSKLRDEFREPHRGWAEGWIKVYRDGQFVRDQKVTRSLAEVSDIVRAIEAREAAKAAFREIEKEL